VDAARKALEVQAIAVLTDRRGTVPAPNMQALIATLSDDYLRRIIEAAEFNGVGLCLPLLHCISYFRALRNAGLPNPYFNMYKGTSGTPEAAAA